MILIKRIWFSFAALVLFVFLALLLVLETVPYFIYFLITGKSLSLSEKATEKTFKYISQKFEPLTNHIQNEGDQ